MCNTNTVLSTYIRPDQTQYPAQPTVGEPNPCPSLVSKNVIRA